MKNLFSYGTLQLTQVQLHLFGRTLLMQPAALVGYKKERIKIKVEMAVDLSREEEHVIISYNGNDSEVVDGVVLSVTQEELENAEDYETEDYKRINATLRSGKSTWVYVKNDKE